MCKCFLNLFNGPTQILKDKKSWWRTFVIWSCGYSLEWGNHCHSSRNWAILPCILSSMSIWRSTWRKDICTLSISSWALHLYSTLYFKEKMKKEHVLQMSIWLLMKLLYLLLCILYTHKVKSFPKCIWRHFVSKNISWIFFLLLFHCQMFFFLINYLWLIEKLQIFLNATFRHANSCINSNVNYYLCSYVD